MKGIAFDNELYLDLQSKHIMERISKFGNKLYLEFMRLGCCRDFNPIPS